MRVGMFRRPVMCDPPSAAAISVLAGKLAGVDGQVNARELAGFHEVFAVPVGQRERLGKLMRRHGASPGDFQTYAARFGQLHRNRPRVVGWALERLQELAMVDGPLNPFEVGFLQETAAIWHLPFAGPERTGGAAVAQEEGLIPAAGVPQGRK